MNLKKSYKLKIGLNAYYFGDGKGKTTTLIGGIIRALGHGLKPILIQFLKKHEEGGEGSGFFMGEINYLKDIIPIKQFGTGQFVFFSKPAKEVDFSNAQRGLECAKKAILSGEYDIVALDEIVDAIALKLVKLEELLEIIEKKPEHVEVIYTGYEFIEKLAKVSDYVIEFSAIEHPYKRGIDARPGIEF